MKTPYKDIYAVLRINRFIVIAVLAFSFLSSGIAVWSVFNINKKYLNNAFAINTDGSVIPLKWVSQKENLSVEVLSHLDLFHSYFYNIDDSNYEKNIEKALWLGNSSIDNLYRQKKADGVYNRILQYSLVQKVLSVESQIDLQSSPYKFETKTIFEINRGTIVDTYELISTGNILVVDRNFPKNTHGLLITNYFEKSLKKLNYEN